MSEFCRYRNWDEQGAGYGEWCGAPAEVIVWGKLYDSDALGPRCYDHAAEQVGHQALSYEFSAIYHLPKVNAPV